MNNALLNRDTLSRYGKIIKLDEIASKTEILRETMSQPKWVEILELLLKLPSRAELNTRGRVEVDFDSASVSIGPSNLLNSDEHQVLAKLIELLIPWRKGPFNLFGQVVDAEWRSNLKWDRVLTGLDLLKGKKVADVGCSNGYYLFRTLSQEPQLVIGLDPSVKCYLSFLLINHLIGDPRLHFEMLGVDDLGAFEGFFDTVLCMGVIYHRKDPFGALQNLKSALKPGGQLILESQAIPGEEPLALCVPDRYAKARNVYFMPTASALEAWLEKTGFVNVEVFSKSEMTVEEQRTTKLSPGHSLSDFLDPKNSSLTVEGHPAPIRVCVKATKK